MESNESAVTVVFSKNRALQLDLCLNSFYKAVTDIDLPSIKVIYKADKKHQNSYKTVASEHEYVEFIEETNFQHDLLDAVAYKSYVLFLTDDTVFTHSFSMQDEVLSTLKFLTASLGFSLRLGTNTHYCYPLDKIQEIPRSWRLANGTLFYRWEYPYAQHDFNYPLELSSSVYRLDDIYPLLSGMEYHNPNELEALMNANVQVFNNALPFLLYFPQSVAFSVPANRVQNVAMANRFREDNRYVPECLLDIYEAGNRVDYSRLFGISSTGAHMEYDFLQHLIKKEDVERYE